jgi:hypothetical protein
MCVALRDPVKILDVLKGSVCLAEAGGKRIKYLQ